MREQKGNFYQSAGLNDTIVEVILELNEKTRFERLKAQGGFEKTTGYDQLLILLVLSGKREVYVQGQKKCIQKGDIIYLKEDSYISSEGLVNEGSFLAFCFYSQKSFLQKFIQKYRQYLRLNYKFSHIRVFKSYSSITILEFAMALINQYERDNKMAEPIIQIKFEEYILMLLFSDSDDHFNLFLSSIVNTRNAVFQDFIESTLLQNLTIADRAKLTNMSVSSFKRKFYELYKDSPGRWFRRQRLKQAKFMIDSSDKSILEVAYELGYESPSHFIKTFKKQYGTTPGKFSLLTNRITNKKE